MKRQYLGDYRDAFKWDLLHWLCTEANPSFHELVFVPLLTPNDPNPRDGQIHHLRFSARPIIQDFVAGIAELKLDSFGLHAITRLGTVDPARRFRISIHGSDREIGKGMARRQYWIDLNPSNCHESIVFLDPDNGFETKTRHGIKWVLHDEVRWLNNCLPESSAVVVYQHRPRYRAWETVFKDLKVRLDDTAFVCAAYDSSLAFIMIARYPRTYRRLFEAATRYASNHEQVYICEIANGSA